MNGLLLEDEDLFEDDSDLVEDEELFAEDDSDLAERRRNFNRRRGSMKTRPVRPGQLPAGKGLFKARPTGQYATQAQLQAGLNRVGAEIRKTAQAIKTMTAQINKNNSDLTAANNRQDTEIAKISSDLKKTGEGGKKQNEMFMLMSLLQKQPELEVKNAGAKIDTSETVVNNVQIKKQDNLLPLLLMSGMGGMGGGDNNMMLMVLALSGKL